MYSLSLSLFLFFSLGLPRFHVSRSRLAYVLPSMMEEILQHQWNNLWVCVCVCWLLTNGSWVHLVVSLFLVHVIRPLSGSLLFFCLAACVIHFSLHPPLILFFVLPFISDALYLYLHFTLLSSPLLSSPLLSVLTLCPCWNWEKEK